MKSIRASLSKKLQHDENLILKLISQMGDMARFMRQMEARIERLERKRK